MGRQGEPNPSKPEIDRGRRRTLIGGLSATAAVAVGGAWVALGRPDLGRMLWERDAPPPPPPDAFISELKQQLPAGNSRIELVNAASEALGQQREAWWFVPSPFRGVSADSFDDAMALVRTRCRDDYAAGRTVSVMSWVISRIEAELIVLLG